jgi:pimeloyl-ACP methyl ester carboxylesterase
MLSKCLSAIVLSAIIGCAAPTNPPTNSSDQGPQQASTALLQSNPPAANETPIRFKPMAGEAIDAYAGSLSVPENWDVSSSRKITVHYVRFKATGSNPGAPIVYLAGGPGGSGIETAKRERFPLFMAMRQFGDVIAFDQRGTGENNTLPVCESAQREVDSQNYTDAQFADLHRLAARECLQFWREQQVDVLGYTSVQSARDLDALRAHLGAKKITLWGISYGTHLALAAMKVMEARIDRVILASVEGLDQTVKSPAETDAYFTRMQAAINAHPALKKDLPDIVALVRRVHAKLDAAPLMLEAGSGDGKQTYSVERRDLQHLLSASIADPEPALRALYLYTALDQGINEPVLAFLRPSPAISFQAMPLAMDLASGISRKRLIRMQREAKTAVLGAYLNFPMPQLDRLLPELDLGDEFRAGPISTVPTLVLMGSLDGRIYPVEQLEAVAGLRNAHVVLVQNAGHNLFMTTPEVTARIESFMRGETVSTKDIIAKLPIPAF